MKQFSLLSLALTMALQLHAGPLTCVDAVNEQDVSILIVELKGLAQRLAELKQDNHDNSRAMTAREDLSRKMKALKTLVGEERFRRIEQEIDAKPLLQIATL